MVRCAAGTLAADTGIFRNRWLNLSRGPRHGILRYPSERNTDKAVTLRESRARSYRTGEIGPRWKRSEREFRQVKDRLSSVSRDGLFNSRLAATNAAIDAVFHEDVTSAERKEEFALV